jgi:hypothetical protein
MNSQLFSDVLTNSNEFQSRRVKDSGGSNEEHSGT